MIGNQTSAFLEALDALVRAPLPARFAFVEGPYVHCSIVAGGRMSSLTESDVLEIEGLTRFQEFCPELVVEKKKERSCLPSTK